MSARISNLPDPEVRLNVAAPIGTSLGLVVGLRAISGVTDMTQLAAAGIGAYLAWMAFPFASSLSMSAIPSLVGIAVLSILGGDFSLGRLVTGVISGGIGMFLGLEIGIDSLI